MIKKIIEKHVIIFSICFIIIGVSSVILQDYVTVFAQTVENKFLYSSLVKLIITFVVAIPIIIGARYERKIGLVQKKGIVKGIVIGMCACVFELIPPIIACFAAPFNFFDFSGFKMMGCVIVYAFSTGLLEELTVRGVLLPLFMDRYSDEKRGIIKAVIFSAGFFTILHFPFFSDDLNRMQVFIQLIYMFWIFIFGVFVSAIVLYSGNIWSGIIIHTIVDIFAYIRYIILPYTVYSYVNVARGIEKLVGRNIFKYDNLAEMVIYAIFSIPELFMGIYLLREMLQKEKFVKNENEII